MIASIFGKIAYKSDKFVIIENGGIGWRVFCSENVLLGLNPDAETQLYTYLHVREGVMDLYGFLNREDREFFEMLISISGIGPKSALGILSIASTKMIKSAILADDVSILTKVSGIGQKTAAKIVLELKSKLQNTMSKDDMAEYAGKDYKKDMEVLDALVGLGYNRSRVREALKQVLGSLTTEEKVKECLRILGK